MVDEGYERVQTSKANDIDHDWEHERHKTALRLCMWQKAYISHICEEDAITCMKPQQE